jgi:ribosomal protein L32
MVLQTISEIQECKKCGHFFAAGRINQCFLCKIEICEQCTNRIHTNNMCEDCYQSLLE